MATFPALQPQTRTYTPGAMPSTAIRVLTGDETSVRHTNSSFGHSLRFTFRGLTAAQQTSITNHYLTHGRFTAFDLPTSVLAGSGLTFPANYAWIYAVSPQTSYSPGLIETVVQLELVPPYTL